MRIDYHGLCYAGFFGDFDSKAFADSVGCLAVDMAEKFSGSPSPDLDCVVKTEWSITTAMQQFVPETDSERTVSEFCVHLSSVEWVTALFGVEHRSLPKKGFRLEYWGAHRTAFFEMHLDSESGTVQLDCNLQDVHRTRVFLESLVSKLRFSEKPVKHSREIPPWLETKLLCDSMHLCNVCRETGVIIHHIEPVEAGGKTLEDNLVVLCSKHHGQAHSKSQLTKNLTGRQMREYKKRHLKWVECRGSPEPLGQIRPIQESLPIEREMKS